MVPAENFAPNLLIGHFDLIVFLIFILNLCMEGN